MMEKTNLYLVLSKNRAPGGRGSFETSKAGFGAGLRHGGDWVGLGEGLRDARDGVPSNVMQRWRGDQAKAKGRTNPLCCSPLGQI